MDKKDKEKVWWVMWKMYRLKIITGDEVDEIDRRMYGMER